MTKPKRQNVDPTTARENARFNQDKKQGYFKKSLEYFIKVDMDGKEPSIDKGKLGLKYVNRAIYFAMKRYLESETPGEITIQLRTPDTSSFEKVKCEVCGESYRKVKRCPYEAAGEYHNKKFRQLVREHLSESDKRDPAEAPNYTFPKAIRAVKEQYKELVKIEQNRKKAKSHLLRKGTKQ